VSDDLVAEAKRLRATSDQLMLAIEEVDARERRKRGSPAASQEADELMTEFERLRDRYGDAIKSHQRKL
jgi:hypothetical protein